MFTKILAAVDGSARALPVLGIARELALRFDAQLYPFRAVFVPPDFPPAAALHYTDSMSEYLVKGATDELASWMPRLAPARVMDPVVRVGPAWRAILDVADELDTDLIVIGSHGYGGWDHLVGTTAARVVDLAKRNVFVVHEALAGPGAP
ncbi:MAG TPA: universal stress protein [Polyangiales bacterium]